MVDTRLIHWEHAWPHQNAPPQPSMPPRTSAPGGMGGGPEPLRRLPALRFAFDLTTWGGSTFSSASRLQGQAPRWFANGRGARARHRHRRCWASSWTSCSSRTSRSGHCWSSRSTSWAPGRCASTTATPTASAPVRLCTSHRLAHPRRM